MQRLEPTQVGDKVRRQAVDEIGLPGLAADAIKRQH
jgi:hypothetical protein